MRFYNMVSKNRWAQFNTQFKYLKNLLYKVYGEMKWKPWNNEMDGALEIIWFNDLTLQMKNWRARDFTYVMLADWLTLNLQG